MKYGVSEQDVQHITHWLGTGTINIFGLPLSGKDTQGKRLAELLDAPLIGGGDIIRNSDRQDVKAIIARGELAPTDDYLAMVTPYFSREEFTGHPLILSSVGRWKGEETVITEAAEKSGHPQKAVVFLNLPIKDLEKRLKISQQTHDRGNRKDDNETYLRTRIEEFKTKTMPVINHYKENGLLVDVDGSVPPDDVTKNIIKGLLAFIQKT